VAGIELCNEFTFHEVCYLGTCYKAANWRKIGQTKGRGRQDRLRTSRVPVKDILVYPLRRDFRELLLHK